jgi:hypothetical protein
MYKCFYGMKKKDMKVLSMQADDHQEQPFLVGPLLPDE